MSTLRTWGRAARCAFASLTVVVSLAHPASGDTAPRRPRAVARAAAPRVERLPQEERRQRVVERFFRGDGIRRCWTRQLLRDPTSASRRLTVALAVDGEGRITRVDVRDRMAPSLAACIAATSVSVAPVGPGEPFETEGTLTLERGES